MKIFPAITVKKQPASADAKVKEVTRTAALAIAFCSVFVFFLKLLFF